MRKLEIIPIRCSETLREVLLKDFKSIGKELPIKGGWGYSKEDAIIIDKNDPAAVNWQPFNGVAMEYLIAEKRVFEELIIFRKKDDQFRQIRRVWNRQELHWGEGGKKYDVIKYHINAFHDVDFNAIDAEVQERIMKEENFDFVKFFESKNDLRYEYEAEFWFEISSFMNA